MSDHVPQHSARRLWSWVTVPSVIWWGVPVAITSTLWISWRQSGASWAGLRRANFWIDLALSLIVIGVGGGHLFGYCMARAGLPITRGTPFRRANPRDRDPPT